MLDAQEVVLELLLLILCLGHEFAELVREVESAGTTADFGLAIKETGDLSFKISAGSRLNRGFFEEWHGDAAFLLQQGEEKMGSFQFLLSMPGGEGLRGIEGFLEFDGEFVWAHKGWLVVFA